MTQTAHNYTGNAWQGDRYDNSLDIKEIAKRVRLELRKEFPLCVFSVTIERYSGGQAMNIALMSAPFEAVLHIGNIDPISRVFTPSNTPITGEAQLNGYAFRDGFNSTNPKGLNNGAQLSKEGWHAMEKAYQIANSYNFDDSNAMIDYFHTNFYLHIEIGKWNKPFVKTEKRTNRAKMRVSEITITENTEKNGIEIRFPEKPDEVIRGKLRAKGFRWSRFAGCWYHKRNADTLEIAKRLVA